MILIDIGIMIKAKMRKDYLFKTFTFLKEIHNIQILNIKNQIYVGKRKYSIKYKTIESA